MPELWDVYDHNRHAAGRVMTRGMPIAPGDFHLVTDIWIMDSRGLLLVQKRSIAKETAPGVWCCTSGSVLAGETSLEGMAREMTEELGVAPELSRARVLFTHQEKNSIVDVWLVRQDIPMGAFQLQPDEVDEVKWISPFQLMEWAGRPEFFRPLPYLTRIADILIKEAQAL